jgi:flagellar biogenesis protein FliO
MAGSNQEEGNMAEEVKKEEKGAGAKKAFSTFLKVVIGLAFLALAAYLLAFRHW